MAIDLIVQPVLRCELATTALEEASRAGQQLVAFATDSLGACPTLVALAIIAQLLFWVNLVVALFRARYHYRRRGPQPPFCVDW
jgi:hypothetical protein